MPTLPVSSRLEPAPRSHTATPSSHGPSILTWPPHSGSTQTSTRDVRLWNPKTSAFWGVGPKGRRRPASSPPVVPEKEADVNLGPAGAQWPRAPVQALGDGALVCCQLRRQRDGEPCSQHTESTEV